MVFLFFSSEWVTNHHRDSLASHIGHHDMTAYFAVAQNDAVGRVRYQLLEVRHRTCTCMPWEKQIIFPLVECIVPTAGPTVAIAFVLWGLHVFRV